jgi:alanine racemase
MDVRSTTGEPRLLIDREALLHNARVIRRAVGSQVKVCAVIKADAYGHGAAMVAQTLCDYPIDEMGSPPVNALAVATIDEAMHLGEIEIPVLILRPVENAFVGRQRQQIEAAIRAGWILTVCSRAAADDVARIALQAQAMAWVQVMVDTGMSRSGVAAAHFDELLQHIDKHPSLRLFGFCTHFACSEDHDDGFTAQQFGAFAAITDPATAARQAKGAKLVRHAANSGAVFGWPQTHLDMVRPGLALYGIHPSCEYGKAAEESDLKPVMKWTANILLMRDVRQGTGVGYGQTWHAPRNSRLGLVPIGYADGYLRELSNKGVMLVHGQPAPVVGIVSMDMTMIDLTQIPDALPGDEVTILDNDPASPASVYRMARQAHTIPYEVFCRIGSRIHRVPVGGEPAAKTVTSSANVAV